MAADVTESSFEEAVIERSRERPVIVDFWAAWCGPCHALAPVLEREAASRDGAVELVKIDVEANPGLAATYRVQGIPAVKGFRDGRVVAEFVGAVGAATVTAFVDQLLEPPALERALETLLASGDLPDIASALQAGEHERALELILAAIPSASPDDRARLRELAVAIFDHLGQDDPVASAYRRQLATALY
jgi:putative thioredoxin